MKKKAGLHRLVSGVSQGVWLVTDFSMTAFTAPQLVFRSVAQLCVQSRS